jgi:SAM-dependent methyltransferase
VPDRWDERYDQETFIFGTELNDFLREEAHRIPGQGDGVRVLCLGDGEGRNGVWLAEQGYAVTAVHLSRVGLAKTQKLAAARGVEIETIFADPDLLITATMIEKDLRGLEIILAHDIEREVIEGTNHTGQASVVQVLMKM